MQRLFITALACLISVSVFSQEETRLALVIGNANYTEGELKNPVNDALLVAETLDSLDFDVILDTNLTDRASFIKSIRSFGTKRRDYDVGFVYYAGHGIQVDGENYLLPTKQIFTLADELGGEIFEEDIIEYGVDVNSILRYLTSEYGEVNILILDACRNNPVRSISEVTRSFTNNEDGLARNPPPSGSLIAYSTDQGKTALDGKGANSIYCESLCRNMLFEGLTIEQVFKRVRLDVERTTQNRQSPVEEQKLTGEDFYLVKSDFEEEYDLIDQLSEKGKYYDALEIAQSIINNENTPTIHSYSSRAILYMDLEEYDKALEDYERCIEIDPDDIYIYYNRADLYQTIEEYDKALEDYARCIEIDPDDPDVYSSRAGLYETIEEYDKAFEDLERCIEIDPDDPAAYFEIAKIYHKLQQYDKERKAYQEAIDVNEEDPEGYYYIGLSYLNESNYLRALIYLDLAIERLSSDLGYYISTDNHDDDGNHERVPLSYLHIQRAEIYERFGDTELMCEEYQKACELGDCDAYYKHCK